MFRKFVASQFRRPSGLLGHWSAEFMDKNNQGYYKKVVEMLAVKDGDTILEIGCGAGQVIKMITDANSRCTVDAIDFSPLMLKKARRNNRTGIKDGRVNLICGDFTTCESFPRKYSKIYLVNVVYLWEDLRKNFVKLVNLLEPGGFVVIFMSSPERLSRNSFAVDSVFNKYSIDQVRETLQRSGFRNGECDIVTENDLDMYYFKAGR